jgi:preprotein translocase subunit SecF
MTFREFFDVYRGYRIPRFKLIEHRNWWFTFSGILIVLSIVGIVFRGFNFSIDFEGGAQLSYPVHTGATVQDIEATLAAYGLTGEVQVVSGDSVAIRTESLTGLKDSTKLLNDLASQAGVAFQDINVQDIGPTWGAEISKKALRGLIIVLIAIGLYIALRFEWAMAAGAMIALVHDVTITAGVYALTGRLVTPETVIAILTILGFSLYDTVVIYDKVQENTESAALLARMGYTKVVDLSLNQTVMRSVNTSLVVLLPILSLLLFGGQTLKDFAFAMFVGVAIGAYSSIFIAAPMLTIIKTRQMASRAPQRVPGRPGAPRPRAAAVAVDGADVAVASDAAARSATARQGGSRQTGSRPRPGQKRRPPAKRKRR